LSIKLWVFAGTLSIDIRSRMNHNTLKFNAFLNKKSFSTNKRDEKKEVNDMTDKEKIVLDKFKNLLLEKISVHYMVLFGSRARGNADEYSDMDVIVITDNLSKEIEDYISDCAWEAGIDAGIVVCPISYSRNEWESRLIQQSMFAESVREDGIYL